jgi:putative flavoprotein involved in K+ transport
VASADDHNRPRPRGEFGRVVKHCTGTLEQRSWSGSPMSPPTVSSTQRTSGVRERDVDVLVVGAGQAGLGTAYRLLHRTDLRVLVVDASPVGQSWLDRWDTLQLFTPRRFSSLPGMPFPDGKTRSPSRTEMARYLRSYVEKFSLPVETGTAVHRLVRSSGAFGADTTGGVIRARQVVVASGPFRRPNVPDAAARLDASVVQLHSFSYRRQADVPPGDVLVVGGGNSAAQLAIELAETHRVTLASPGSLWFLPEDVLGVSMYWWTLLTGVLNAGSGAWISRYVRRRGDAIVGTQLRRLIATGRIDHRPHRVVGGSGRLVELADGSVLPAETVLWCTGFRPDTDWIDIPGAIDEVGAPLHHGGASPVPGLHWMGLPWQTRLNSSIIDGVDRDAELTVQRIMRGLHRRT